MMAQGDVEGFGLCEGGWLLFPGGDHYGRPVPVDEIEALFATPAARGAVSISSGSRSSGP